MEKFLNFLKKYQDLKLIGWVIGFIIAISTLYLNYYTYEQIKIINKEQLDSTRNLVVMQLKESRKLSELSLKPNLSFPTIQSVKDSKQLQLSNNGIGPAIIKKLEFRINGKLISDKNGFIINFDNIINKLNQNSINEIEYISDFAVGSSIRPGQIITIFQTSPSYHDPQLVKNLDKLIQKIKIDIWYSPIYSDTIFSISYPNNLNN